MNKAKYRWVRDPFSTLFSVAIIASLILFNILPLFKILIQSFTDAGGESYSLMGYVRAFTYRANRQAILNTLLSSTCCAVLATLIGFVFAYCSCYVKMRAKKLFNFVAMLPIVSPPFSVSLAIILLFGSKWLVTKTLFGISNFNIYGFWGLLFAQTFSFFPMAYLMLNGVLCTIDPSIEEAARDMGASRWRTFTKVTLPLSLPGIGNAFLLIFIKCAADFGNPIAIGGDYGTMATQIYSQAVGGYEMQRCCALSMLLLVMTLVIYLCAQLLLEKRTFVTITGKATRERVMIDERHISFPLTGTCIFFAVIVLGMYLLIPVVSFFKLWGINYTLTFDNYIEAWKIGKQSLVDTLELAAITTPVAGVIAMIMSFLIVRRKNRSGKLMETLGMMGMIVPGTVLGYAYILQFNTRPFLLAGSMLILVASCCSRYLPMGLRSGITSLRQIDPSIEESASDLGASSAQVFVKITLPLIKSAFFGGLVYTFVRTMTSMSALIFLITAKHKLLTTSIMSLVDRGKYGAATALGSCMIVIVFVSIFILYKLIGLFGVNKKEIKLM